MNILLGQPDGTGARPGMSAVELDLERRAGQTILPAGQEQTAPGRGRGPLETVWELALFFSGVITRHRYY